MIGGAAAWVMWQQGETTWLNPLAKQLKPMVPKDDYEVVGFLPPWTIEKASIVPTVLDQLVFLGVEANEKGELVWDAQAKKMDNGRYLLMKQQMVAAGKKNVLGVKLFDDQKIDQLMASTEAQGNLINQIKSVVESKHYDGVNVDFEYQGDAQAVLEDEFVAFLAELKNVIGKEVSVDVFANTVIKGDSTALGKMVSGVDYMVVMAYDFHRPGNNYVGPVAPIGSPAGTRNIMEVVERVVTLGLDKSKIIMAYPLYGYEWKTESTDFGAGVVGSWAQMASYSRVQDLIKGGDKTVTVKWDDNSMTPYLYFTETETAYRRVRAGKKWKSVPYQVEVVHQIYYEDNRSLGVKYDLVKNSQMGGVGFWALGYEGAYDEVWRELREHLTAKN